jgi:predicted  nucleic acid-binding Zn-ribbon protein
MEEPLEIYDDLKGKYINYDEKYKSKFNAAENLVSNSDFWAKSIENLKAEMLSLRGVISDYKKSLKDMNDFITERHHNNANIIQVTMKSFSADLKEKLHGKKNENYQLVRELQHLNREKLGLRQQIDFSSFRIMELEKIVGVRRGNN